MTFVWSLISYLFFLIKMKKTKKWIHISEEILEALRMKRAIVALESTIISHGMPYPLNLEVAKEVEEVIRRNNAIPATIAIIHGVPHVGLSDSQLEILARNKESMIRKASTRDLGFICANKLTAATTVASTMRFAHCVGISVFATGGIGGVHRGAEVSMDVSADLIELSRTPVTVVCAGIKSILDIPKSLEVLETYGVPVLGYKSEQFPAFYHNNSGISSPLVANSSAEIASIMQYNALCGHNTGIVVGVPNPMPVINSKELDVHVQSALEEAERGNISGPAITPFLLSRIEKLTTGKSLDANIALIKHNARIAAQVAIEYASVCQSSEERIDFTSNVVSSPVSSTRSRPVDEQSEAIVKKSKPDVLVVGGAVMDLIGSVDEFSRLHTSNPGKLVFSSGGVGRNIAQAVAIIFRQSSGGAEERKVILASAVGDDISGQNILKGSESLGIDTSLIKVLPLLDSNRSNAHGTAVYNAIHDEKGDLVIGIADMNIFKEINPHYIKTLAGSIENAQLIVVDGNIPIDSFAILGNICRHYKKPIFFEPTSDAKCLLPFHAESLDQIAIMKPNISELVQMVNFCYQKDLIQSGKALVGNTLSSLMTLKVSCSNRSQVTNFYDLIDVTDLRILANALYQVLINSRPKGFGSASIDWKEKYGLIHRKHLIVSLGSRGILWVGPTEIIRKKEEPLLGLIESFIENEDGSSAVCHLRAHEIAPVAKAAESSTEVIWHTNGAGDAFCAGVIARMIHKHNVSASYQLPDYECIICGLDNARGHIEASSPPKR